MSTPTPREALVIGGSLAGLVTARVLADHVNHVTILERRPEPAPGESIAAQGRIGRPDVSTIRTAPSRNSRS